MNAATVLSLLAAAIEIVVGLFTLAFAAAPGWRHFRIFALIALSAAAYSLGDAVFAYANASRALIPWVARLNTGVACAHCAAWVAYVRAQYADPLRKRDRAAIALLACVALLACIPSVVMTDVVIGQRVSWANVSYHVTKTSDFGSLVVAAIPLTLLGPVLGYYRKARAKAPGARAHLVGFSIFFATALNEVLVSLGVIQNLYLADIGFLAAVLSVSADLVYRVTGDARRLQALSTELSRQVDERTQELSVTRDNLIRAERLAALGRLSASIGHEINNPLSYVSGNLEYIARELERTGTDANVMDALHDAASGADRIRKIVQELRVFSRGADRDRGELVDVRELIETSLKLVWGELRHRARLVRELDAVPKVLANSTRLTQVFVNVLMNAAQAIPEERAGGPDALITLRTRLDGPDHIMVEISDTGVGIEEKDRARLFEPFFSTKPQDKGTGLGLFVSLGIVTSLGGRIDVESRLGEGTLVRVVLPVAHGVAPSVAPPASLPPPALENRRLLVIDDDVLVARTLARLLNRHQVDIVTSGEEALHRIEEAGDEFDLVLCDLMMPDMTGMDVYERVRESNPKLAERFVFISGGGVSERSRKFLELHADRVLKKPIDGRKLARVVAERSRDPGERVRAPLNEAARVS